MGLSDLLGTSKTVNLEQFRANPSVVEQNAGGSGFNVDLKSLSIETKIASGVENVTEGGKCSFVRKEANNGITTLEGRSSEAGTDYWFPYPAREVGFVKVPSDAPKGTIVATPGMNGCSLIITECDGDLYFCHDPNGEIMLGKGETLSKDQMVGLDNRMRRPRLGEVNADGQVSQHRVKLFKDSQEYAGGAVVQAKSQTDSTGKRYGGMVRFDNAGQKEAADASRSGKFSQFSNHLVSVKTEGGWEVYNFGVLTDGKNKPYQTLETPNKRKLLGRF